MEFVPLSLTSPLESTPPPGANVIYERPPSPLTPQHERDPSEASLEKRTKLEARRRNTVRLPPEPQLKSDRTERVRIDRERAPPGRPTVGSKRRSSSWWNR